MDIDNNDDEDHDDDRHDDFPGVPVLVHHPRAVPPHSVRRDAGGSVVTAVLATTVVDGEMDGSAEHHSKNTNTISEEVDVVVRRKGLPDAVVAVGFASCGYVGIVDAVRSFVDSIVQQTTAAATARTALLHVVVVAALVSISQDPILHSSKDSNIDYCIHHPSIV